MIAFKKLLQYAWYYNSIEGEFTGTPSSLFHSLRVPRNPVLLHGKARAKQLLPQQSHSWHQRGKGLLRAQALRRKLDEETRTQGKRARTRPQV